jgi:hypothetical protein
MRGFYICAYGAWDKIFYVIAMENVIWNYIRESGWSSFFSPFSTLWYIGFAINYRVHPIDYRCDDEKKKFLSWGNILLSLRSWRLRDSKNAGH